MTLRYVFVTLKLNTSQFLELFESKICHRHKADRLCIKECRLDIPIGVSLYSAPSSENGTGYRSVAE